ncbi:MAG: TIGR02266 family protein [Deltaproteobacteria bacterium]|nr:MAG: TIGR02266 family protein [Deltaproteobacteria bacterium]
MNEREFGGQRKEARLVVNREFASLEEFITEYVANISKSGAFIRTDEPLPVGTKVALRFTIIADDMETIEGIGEVVRVTPPGGPHPAGMGVVFRQLSEYSKTLLDRLLTT